MTMTEKDYETKVQEIAQSACYDKAEKLDLTYKGYHVFDAQGTSKVSFPAIRSSSLREKERSAAPISMKHTISWGALTQEAR